MRVFIYDTKEGKGCTEDEKRPFWSAETFWSHDKVKRKNAW